MTQTEFWSALECRLSHEFSGMTYRPFRFLWCDGFDPELYELDQNPLCIRGKTWINDGPGDYLWEFRLILNRPCTSIDEIDWDSLLPPDNMTRWLAVDLQRRYVEIEPGAAVSDGEEPKQTRMGEREFWVALMFRLCHEFNGMAEREYRRLWCDGFDAQLYEIDQDPPCILGKIWIGDGRRDYLWDFRLILNRRYSSIDEIDWTSLLPEHNLTRWISVDLRRQYIEIEPSAAQPDLLVPKPIT